MERLPCNSLQNFDDPKTEILKNRLLKSANSSIVANTPQNNTQQNVLMNNLRPPISNSMLVSSLQAPQSSIPLNNIVTHSIGPVKIHTNNAPYPLQLSTVHVPVQIPGSTSNINVPVQLSSATSSLPLQLATSTVSLPIQVSGTTTNVPVQLPAGDTINVPLQIPGSSQSIQLTTPGLPSMPMLQNSTQSLHNSIFHVHMGSNPRAVNTSLDGTGDLTVVSTSSLQMTDSNVHMKMTNNNCGANSAVVQIPNSSSNAIQLQLPSSGTSTAVQLRGSARSVPQVVYIQTPTGLKPVTSTEVISQASTSGNPPQIIVRRPVTSAPGIQLISNVSKPNIAPKVSKSSILATANSSQPIVIQKPKANDKMMVPVSIGSGTGKQGNITYLGTVKKNNTSKISENQSILIANNQLNSNINSTGNQKLFITPMNMPKLPNTKFILPVNLPTMASKGPIINLQIANGQIQNDPQGNITVMRDSTSMDTTEIMPPLQPLGKGNSVNGKELSNIVPHSPKAEKTFTLSIPGSRAESTGEQEYTLSIPETNASMNDDIYTVSIADEEGGQTREKSFTLAIPEKGKSLVNKSVVDRDMPPAVTIPAPAILRRSNSDNCERKTFNTNIKRRISLCTENISSKSLRLSVLPQKYLDKMEEPLNPDNNDDHRVPSLFCDEELDKDLESKVHIIGSDSDDHKNASDYSENKKHEDCQYYQHEDKYIMKECKLRLTKRESSDSALEEDPPGLLWNNGVAKLQGSTIQFQTNEFGIMDLIENNDHEKRFLLNPSNKYQKPLNERAERNGRDKKPTSPEDLYRCDGCGCHGMAADFITPNFCSSACQSDVQKALQKKKDRGRADLLRKKTRLKRLSLRKQHMEAGQLSEKDERFILKHYDENAADALLLESIKGNEEGIENEKYPWMCLKNGFSWMKYLDFCKAKAAPVKLFGDPFPYSKNRFKVGMRLEAIDPSHPSLFCVVSVAEVAGYRMRLHFDEYSDMYDYWVNADCVDTFPPGWSEKNGRALRPPAGYSPASFSWPLYLKQKRAIAAPKHLFPHLCTTMIKPNGFRIGMKLEAEDRKNKLVCVATVADMLDNRILINFDSWDEMYDYWVDPTSPYIHPVGWAEENGISLTPPNFYKDPDSFTWESYLAETGATPAPARAFKTRPPLGYRVGMKLEVVDQRVPFLIRVASISEVKGHRVRVSFDGWPDELSHWLDDDSPDLHPVGYCLKTGHPLEPPLTEEESRVCGPCGVGGCRGLGSLHGPAHKSHAAASTCPYRRREPPLRPDRLARSPTDHALPRPRKVLKLGQPSTPSDDTPKEKSSRGRPPKHKRIEEVTKKEPVSDEESVGSGSVGKRWRLGSAKDVEAEVIREYPARPPQRPLAALRPRSLQAVLRRLALTEDPAHWTQSEVTALVSLLAGSEAAAAVCSGRVSGAELLMVSCEELVECLRLRLGPAIKIYTAVKRLRETCM